MQIDLFQEDMGENDLYIWNRSIGPWPCDLKNCSSCFLWQG